MKRGIVLKLAFGAALVLTLAFGTRLVMQAVYWNDPRNQDLEIAGWMRLGYVARSWDVPPDVLREATGLPAAQTYGRSLQDLAERRGIALPALIETLETAIQTHRAQGPSGS